ncbi:hypothetical protein [Sphingobium chungbukense]|nr:hypothetical protein [Sphingobium chungbukense]
MLSDRIAPITAEAVGLFAVGFRISEQADVAVIDLPKLLATIVGIAHRATGARHVGVMVTKIVLTQGAVQLVTVGLQVGVAVHIVHVADHPVNQPAEFGAGKAGDDGQQGR